MAREDGFFDDLARGLADGTLTRGRALGLMGAAVVGGALGSLGIGEASADPPGCKRNGKNCTRNAQCCSGNCSGGTCRAQTTTTTTTTTPPPPVVCSPVGNCDNVQLGCAGNSDCSCVRTAEGSGLCVDNVACMGLQACGTSTDCPPGNACVVDSCCGVPVCAPFCSGATAVAAARVAGPTISGG